jgi:hypothetical protein
MTCASNSSSPVIPAPGGFKRILNPNLRVSRRQQGRKQEMSNKSAGRKVYLSLAVLGLVAGASVLAASPASARGCNGVVSQGEWYCAYWDNNNGPQFPHYRAPQAAPRAVIAPGAQGNGSNIYRNSYGQLVDRNTNRVISNDGGSVMSNASGGLVGPSGGTSPRGNGN